MKTPIFFLAAVLMSGMAGAQSARQPVQPQQDAAETAARLQAIQANAAAEKSRISGETPKQQELDGKLKSAANMLREPNGNEKLMAQKGQGQLDAAIKNLSGEAKSALSSAALKAAAGSGGSAAQPAASAEPPKPAPLKPTSLANPDERGKNKVIITAKGAAFFDPATSIGLFTEDVEVHHPQFYIQCDEFEIHLIPPEKKPAEAKPGDPKAAADKKPEPAKPASEGAGNESVKMAIARGRTVTIEKLTETGDVQVGRCKHATYQGASEDTILRDWPQVQRGQHLQIATDPSTYMVIKKNGELKTYGPSRTEILQESEMAKPKGNLKPIAGGSPAPSGATISNGPGQR